MYRWLLALLCCLSVVCGKVVAENYPTMHFTVENGLPSNTVYYTYRDNKGFIWVATDKGVARYNGIKFEIFTTANGLPDNEVFNMQEDKSGRLWFSTFNGKLCFYQDGFHNAKNTPYLRLPFKTTQIMKIIPEYDSSVTFMFETRDRFINIGKNSHSVVYLKNDTDVARFIFPRKLSKTQYLFTYQTCQKTVDTGHRLLATNEFSCYYGGIPCIGWDLLNAQGQLYIVNEHYIYNTDLKCIASSNDKLTKGINKLYTVYFDTTGLLFKATDSGIVTNDIKFLTGQSTPSITQDLMGNYWVATLRDGVYVVPSNYQQTKIYKDAYTGDIRYAYADENNLFFNNSDNDVFHMRNDTLKRIFEYQVYRKRFGEYANNHGYLITKSGQHQYNYLNFYNNFIFYITDLGRKNNLHMSPHPFNPGEIVKSIVDVNEDIYIRTIKKVFSIKLEKFLQPETLNKESRLLSDNADRIFAFTKSTKNEVWFSDNINGIYRISNGATQLQRQFKEITFNKFEFFNKYLVGYTLDDNQLLVCSNIEGKLHVDTVPRQNCIWDKFYKIDDKHLLISTNNLYRLFTIRGDKNYSISIVENQFLPTRVQTICSDGKYCYFFAKGTITKMDIQQLLEKALQPRLFFKAIKYGSKRYLMREGLTVPYKSSENVSIFFSTLSFSGQNIIYQYSVSKTGTDKWEMLDGEQINLTVPGFGKWQIKVRARTVSGSYGPPITYTLNITPPYWATWWFITISSLFILSIVVVGVRLRLKWILNKNMKDNENKIKFMKSEYKALNALMNPHFIFNTLNNVQGLVNRNDKLAANEYLRIFADLVRQNMHNVSKEMIPLQKEIDLVDNYLALEKLRFKELLNYSVDVDDEVDTSAIMVPPLLIQPLVENSIKHGILPMQSTNSRVELNVFEVNDMLHIEVRDNGVGINLNKPKTNPNHESFGLQNIQNRINQLSIITGKKMTFLITEKQLETGKWTIVSITMPLN